ncbi:exodeoxyribonuclease VII small subunit [Cyanobium sp. WAJ14-Wanaka]|uniref:exodeoxyribonuclease VII small subunit n=1 Tax=Cyanobium sp. WAJ14-Wanaka TaxID=2823725 RepID=UPI0020CEE579|nr:exodeoxyribonuclease VII small subunit [Cyanobium sp. WAJ14-Wanaka]
MTASLSYAESRTALELTLSQLQSNDLDVEAMAGLYRQAMSYADRCEALLESVEQEVKLWDMDKPDSPPETFKQESPA